MGADPNKLPNKTEWTQAIEKGIAHKKRAKKNLPKQVFLIQCRKKSYLDHSAIEALFIAT